ncbi:MAG: translin family protein [Thermoplasmata archaeon]|nr:translin family protein [Thermoplasmata archaeon]
MENLDEIADMIEAELNEKDTLREIALKSARAIIRLSGAAVRSMHKGEDPSVLLDEARDEASRLRGLLLDHPDLYSAGFVEDAMQEFTEAVVLRHIVENRELPTPSEIDVSSTAYLLGLGDVVGELRRSALDCLRQGDLGTAMLRLEQMEAIHDTLMRFDYPSALVAVRRKQDISRTLIEKTRGELAIASRTAALEKMLTEKEKTGKENKG